MSTLHRGFSSILAPTVSKMHPLVDIGANLTHHKYHRDLEDVLARATGAGVARIICTGTDVTHSLRARQLCERYADTLTFTSGCHPHHAKELTDNGFERLRDLLQHPQCSAVGECGLDYNRNFSPPEQQLCAFERQLDLACSLNKPLFIHERDAHEDMVRLLSARAGRLPPAVIHCFTGTVEQAKQYIDMGLYIGLTGFFCKERSDVGVQTALKRHIIPLERLMIETDAPFMYPNISQRNKRLPAEVRSRLRPESITHHQACSYDRNEPCSLAAIVDAIAAFMNVPVEDVAEATTRNAKNVFQLN